MAMDLLEETREILDGLSSGTLSPVSLAPPSPSLTTTDRLVQLKAALAESSLEALEEFEDLAEERFGLQKWTALHVAAQEGPSNAAVFQCLLRRGVDALAKDTEGLRARQILLSNNNNSPSAPTQIISWLQEWEGRQVCAKKEKLFRLCNSEASSFKAILQEASDDGSRLMERVACGITPLHQLASRNRGSVLKRLFVKLPHLIAQLPSCLTTLNGNSILHEAARWGARESIREIVEVAPDLAHLKNAQNLLPIELCTSEECRALLTDAREERKMEQIIELISATDASPKKRGRPRIYQPGQSPSKLKKLRQQVIKEQGVVSVKKPAAVEKAEAVLKRGPGRPRKTPALPTPTELDILSGKCDLSQSNAKQITKLMSVPVSKIFADSIGCVLLVRLRGEWWAFSHQLEAIHAFLKNSAEASADEKTAIKAAPVWPTTTALTRYDHDRLNLLPDLGRLTSYLKSYPLSPLVPKSAMISFLESTHQLALSGPFGYVDVDQLSPVKPAPLPLKLKLKLEAKGSLIGKGSVITVGQGNAEFTQQAPKSPRILQM